MMHTTGNRVKRGMAALLSALLMFVQAPAVYAEFAMGGVAIGGGSVVVMGDAEDGEAFEPSVSIGKSGVSIENTQYDYSAVLVAGDIYMLGNSRLAVLREGAQAFETVAQYDGSYAYVSREEIAQWDDETRELASKTPGKLLSDGVTLYGLAMADGSFGPIGEDGFIQKSVTLDWENMYNDSHLRSAQWERMLGGAVYMLLEPMNSGGSYSTDEMRVTRFDIETGEAKELGLAGEYSLSEYKDGKLLAYAAYGGDDRDVRVYDPETDTLGDTLIPFAEYDEPDTVGISYNAGGFAYDAASDTVYFGQDSMVKAFAGGQITDIAYLPVSYATNIRQSTVSEAGYFCTSWDGIYLRSLDEEDQPERILRISGGFANDTSRAFAKANPDTPVVFSDAWYTGAESVRTDMLSGNSDVDIYVLDVLSGVRALMEKGYLQPIESEALSSDVARMYPQIADALMQDGKLYAYPSSFSMMLWGINTQLWEELELGDYPVTFLDYVELINTFNDEYAEEYPDYTVTNLYNGKQELISQALAHYVYQYEAADQALSFNTPAFIETIKALEELDIDPVDWENMSQADMEALWERMDRPALFSMNLYQTVESSGNYYRTPEGQYEEYQIRKILPPVYEAGKEGVAPASLNVFVINPQSENIDLAIQFLEYYAQNAEATLRYAIHPDLTEPVRPAYYERNRRQNEKYIAELEAELEKADEETKQDYQDSIDAMRTYLEEAEQTEWLISEQSLANYRELAQAMRIPYDSTVLGYDSAGMSVLQDVFARYTDGQLTLDALVRELDQKLKMIYLEGN